MQSEEMTERNFEIRDADVADIPIIMQLIRDLATYERAPNDVIATEQDLREVLFGAEPAAKVVIGFEDTAPVGFAVYFFNFSTWLGRPGLYLEDLFVKPQMRGRGYGRALLVHLAKIARDHNCGRMEWAVLTWNDPAIEFYKKLGAMPLDSWRIFRLTKDEIGKLAET
jgi:GNAT superfamily N-acetyltransferase